MRRLQINHQLEYAMREIKYLLLLGFTLFMMGCPARSLSPLFEDKDLVFKPELIGTWVNPDHEVYTFHSVESKKYEVSMHDEEGNVTVVSVKLGQVGKTLFLDSYPAAKNDNYYLLKSHIFTRMWLKGDTLKMASLEGDYLKAQIISGKLKVAHAFQGDDVVLTASTEELQQLVLSLAENEAAFPNLEICIRRK